MEADNGCVSAGFLEQKADAFVCQTNTCAFPSVNLSWWLEALEYRRKTTSKSHRHESIIEASFINRIKSSANPKASVNFPFKKHFFPLFCFLFSRLSYFSSVCLASVAAFIDINEIMLPMSQHKKGETQFEFFPLKWSSCCFFVLSVLCLLVSAGCLRKLQLCTVLQLPRSSSPKFLRSRRSSCSSCSLEGVFTFACFRVDWTA